MSRERWKEISACFTIYDPTKRNEVHEDKYWKVNNIIEEINGKCRQNYNFGESLPGKHLFFNVINIFVGQFLSRDEQCIKSNHRTSLRHTRMPKKYIQTGIRVEAVTTPSGSYFNIA